MPFFTPHAFAYAFPLLRIYLTKSSSDVTSSKNIFLFELALYQLNIPYSVPLSLKVPSYEAS